MSNEQLCVVCPEPGKLRCSRCKSIVFCSAAHQALLWPTHKYLCKPYSPITFAQPPLELAELRRYILGPELDDPADALGSCVERFCQLVHPSTVFVELPPLQVFASGADASTMFPDSEVGRRVATSDTTLWENYHQILRSTPPAHHADIVGHVRRTIAHDHPVEDTLEQFRPFTILALMLLEPQAPNYRTVSILGDVGPRERNAFELQALTVFSLLYDEGGLLIRELDDDDEDGLVDLGLRRLRDKCGNDERLGFVSRAIADVVKRAKEDLRKWGVRAPGDAYVK